MRLGLALGLGDVPTIVSPDAVPGLVLWFETDFGIDHTGSVCNSWTCRKSGFVASQATSGKKPVYSASDSNFNGRPSLSGTIAAATQLTNTTDTPFSAGATRTYFFVFKSTNVPPDVNYFTVLHDSRHAATARPIFEWGNFNNNTYVLTDGVAINETIPAPANFNAKHLLSEIRQTGVQAQVWLDGVSQTVTNVGGTDDGGDVAAAGFDIFSRQNGAEPFEGKIVALLAYNGALSTANRQLIERYIALKYGF